MVRPNIRLFKYTRILGLSEHNNRPVDYIADSLHNTRISLTTRHPLKHSQRPYHQSPQ
jgi:hypothetical protein